MVQNCGCSSTLTYYPEGNAGAFSQGDRSLVRLVSIPMCFWFLSIQVVYDLFSILRSLIATCTYLLSRFLLLTRYGKLFNKVIMLSPLMLRILTYIFLLLSITVIFVIFWQNKSMGPTLFLKKYMRKHPLKNTF